jgi:excinuclease UvrABC nuclease subunit
MASQAFEIEFDGYWREPAKGGTPSASGIYCVYSCVHNKEEKTVSIKKLIYIGESGDVKDRLSGHEKLDDWKKHVKTGEVLCYSVAEVAATNRVRCEAAMINKHKPPVNTEYVNSFPFDQTTMKLSGKTKKLHTEFTVIRS